MPADEVRAVVAKQLRLSQAHAGLARALDHFPVDLVGRRVRGHVHTAWQQVEHMRLAAEDLVSYCRDGDYRARDWPAGYWPDGPEPASPGDWSASADGVLRATEEMATLVEDPAVDIYAPVPTGEKPEHHTLRAALILLDHNAYHAAQLVALRRALEAWPHGDAL